ncbi:MAG: hypothetical protein ACKPKO_26420, partial [Candidatus Fonsibacter sp.]
MVQHYCNAVVVAVPRGAIPLIVENARVTAAQFPISAMVAGAAVLAVGVLSFTVSALLRSNRPKPQDDVVASTVEILLPATTAASSDPQALLRALSRTRKSHVVVLPWMGETKLTTDLSKPPSGD